MYQDLKMFLFKISSILLCLLSLSDVVQSRSFPMPMPCTGEACANPFNKLDYQDFSLIQRESDGRWFRFAKSNTTGQGITVANAPSLRGPWKYSGEILTGHLKSPAAVIRADTNLWAPEIHHINGTYYLFYSAVSAPSHFDLCVATSPTMDLHAWTDHGSMDVPISHDGSYVRLDGNLLAHHTDPSGESHRHYMVFGSYLKGLYGFHLEDNLLKIKAGTKPKEVIADQKNPKPYAGHKTEGAYQFKNGNYRYIFYSIGNCCPAAKLSYADSVYRVEVCRTPVSNPPGKGPYLDRNGDNCLTGSPNRHGTVVLASHRKYFIQSFEKAPEFYLNADSSKDKGAVFAPGSVGIVHDPKEGLVMTYQYFNIARPTRGLHFGFNYLEFDSDGWPRLVKHRRRKGQSV